MTRILFIIMIALWPALVGCSGGGGPSVIPMLLDNCEPSLDGSHAVLGYWQIIADPEAGIIEVIELRDVQMHLNGLHFLEPPVYLNLTLESPAIFSGGKVDVDIGIRHPFLGLVQYTGFDLCGILITSGSLAGYTDDAIVVAGPGDTRLLNADGLTRWWNPREFPPDPVNPIKGYQDGLLGTPDSGAGYTCTLNGYKYFADGLGKDAPVDSISANNRGCFSVGKQHVRHYTIALDGGFVFNYAVDACWASTGLPPDGIEVPGSFSPFANRPEPFFISTQILNNSLWYKDGESGGTLQLLVVIFDWFNVSLDDVTVECPGVFELVTFKNPWIVGPYTAHFVVNIANPVLESTDDIHLLISGICEETGYQGNLPGKAITAYAPLLPVTISDGS